jgi:hypothetical protein
MKTYLDLLPNDILEKMKMMVAVNPPPHLNLYEVLFIQYINKMNTKELIKYCNDNGIKKSQYSVNNQYVKRCNIIEKYLDRKLTRDDELVITFTRGDSMNTYKGWVI